MTGPLGRFHADCPRNDGRPLRPARRRKQAHRVGFEILEDRVLLAGNPAGDYDGDGKADIAVFRPTTADWLIHQSSAGPLDQSFGMRGDIPQAADVPVPADYDGTGHTEIAVFRPTTAQWFILGPPGSRAVQFGAPGDIPVPADYDGDGKTDMAVYRPTSAQWFIQGSSTGGRMIQFGEANHDEPVPADYNGDGKADVAVFRPETATWYILSSAGGGRTVQFGAPNLDIPLPADYNGDGKADIAVFRPTTATWMVLGSSGSRRSQQFGAPNLDIPVPADYDGDGKVDFAVFRPTTAEWMILPSSGGARHEQFGASNLDIPLSDRTRPPVGADAWAWPAPGWTLLQQDYIARSSRGTDDVVFLGDSITFLWGDTGRAGRGYKVWQDQIAPLRAANFGMIGDRTETLLWRVQNGELAGHPPVVVLMIGFNNLTSGESPQDTATGIAVIVHEIQRISPQTKVLLLGLLPAGEDPNNPLRARIAQVNAIIAHLDNGSGVHFLDLGSRFLRPDGSISPTILTDFVHPSQQGYQILSAGIQGPLQTMLGKASLGLRTAIADPKGDYDGDGKADLAVYRPGTGQWIIAPSTGGVSVQKFGAPYLETLVPGDYDSDGKTDIAVFRPDTATWSILLSSGGTRTVQFGATGDIPVQADYDGTGHTEIAVYRPSTGQWFTLGPNGGRVVQYGMAGDIPVPADYDGDGSADVAVYRPSTGQWLYLLIHPQPWTHLAPEGSYMVQFGAPNLDIPLPGDFDGDGKADFAVYRPTNSTWYILQSGAGPMAQRFGEPGDIPVPGDFDGSGQTQIAVYRRSTGQWFFFSPTTGIHVQTLGTPSLDIPVPSTYDGHGQAVNLLALPSVGTWSFLPTSALTHAEAFAAASHVALPSEPVGPSADSTPPAQPRSRRPLTRDIKLVPPRTSLASGSGERRG